MKPLYTARATTTGGRNGHIRSDDGLLDLDVSVPKSMGGPAHEICPYSRATRGNIEVKLVGAA